LLVIGAAIGTTVTGVIAAMGGTVMAKRTAVAHVVFNLASGLIALLVLPLYLQLIEAMQHHLGLQAGATSLAAFHTLCIGMGVAVFLPLARHYARLIERLVPQRDHTVTQQLDDSLLQIPSLALQATQATLADIANRMRLALLALVDGHGT